MLTVSQVHFTASLCSPLPPPSLPPPLGNSSFQSWTYYINYTKLGSSTSVQSVNTSSLSLTLTDLLPDSLYEFTVSAAGPGGEVVNPSTFILQTKMEGNCIVLHILRVSAIPTESLPTL